MPKAAMHEDHAFKAWKNKVRGSWKVLSVEPKSISEFVDKSTNGQFGLGVLSMDPPHAFAALCWGKGIGHAYSLVSPILPCINFANLIGKIFISSMKPFSRPWRTPVSSTASMTAKSSCCDGRRKYPHSTSAALPFAFLRSLGSRNTLRRRIDFGVTSTRSSSSI